MPVVSLKDRQRGEKLNLGTMNAQPNHWFSIDFFELSTEAAFGWMVVDDDQYHPLKKENRLLVSYVGKRTEVNQSD